MIARHQWCSISSVKYRVWVKSDMDEAINIDKVQVTCGVSDVFYIYIYIYIYIWWLPLMHYSCRLYTRCHAPNRFGTVNMEDNTYIEQSLCEG